MLHSLLFILFVLLLRCNNFKCSIFHLLIFSKYSKSAIENLQQLFQFNYFIFQLQNLKFFQVASDSSPCLKLKLYHYSHQKKTEQFFWLPLDRFLSLSFSLRKEISNQYVTLFKPKLLLVGGRRAMISNNVIKFLTIQNVAFFFLKGICLLALYP